VRGHRGGWRVREAHATRNTQRRAEVSVSVRERAIVPAGSAEPSIPLAQGTDRTREDDGMNTGLVLTDRMRPAHLARNLPPLLRLGAI
jgi:hypothetical protein